MVLRPTLDLLPWELRLGATVEPDGRTTFRAWAPEATAVAVAIGAEEHPMAVAGGGTWTVTLPVGHGTDYWLTLDGSAWPDPHSRWQPAGIRGPSRVCDPSRLGLDAARPALDHGAQVLYELHVGTFTAEGTFDAAIEPLAELAELGITAVELMPVNEFPGHHGWGYDGVYLGAAQSSYGGPEGLARFVEAAHRHGLGVILDVVYNHVGPTGGEGLAAFGPYFTSRYQTPWGDAPNLDGPDSGAVREWMLQSAEWWIRDLRIDGLRVDALHAIVDGSALHLCAELTERVRAIHPGALLIAESGLNDPRTIRPVAAGGWGFDADWADDFHHALRTTLTDEADGWFADYGTAEQLALSFVEPYLFAGHYVPFRGRRFGAPATDRDPTQFVVFAQNHDQVGNRATGDRLPPALQPLAALCLLFSAATPMLFMGEEYGEDAPFQYFCDHIDPFIAEATTEGRKREFARSAGFSEADVPDPQDPATFERSKLTWRRDPAMVALTARMIELRRSLPPGRPTSATADGAVVRVVRGEHELVANFGSEPVTLDRGGRAVAVAAGTVGTADDAVVIEPMSGLVLARTNSDRTA